MSFNLSIQKAVQYLYGKGMIVKDADISTKTGYNKSSISGIINGKAKASAKFMKTFEKAFDLKLSDFSDGGSQETIIITDAIQLISESMIQLKAEAITNRQMSIEILSAVSQRSVSDVQLLSDKLLSHNLAKLVAELKRK
jgi:transcriptional regulator with XRE-family HTH domain